MVRTNRIIPLGDGSANSAEPAKLDGANGSEIPAAPFPSECLPPVPRRLLADVVESLQVPPALAGCCILGILAASIGAGLEVQSGGDRRTRGNLYLLPVAESGTGKGQAFQIIAAPFLAAEQILIESWNASTRPDALAEQSAAEAEILNLKKAAAKSDGEARADVMEKLRDAQKLLLEQQEALVEPCLCLADATREALALELSRQPGEALASLSAEARGVVDVLAGRYSNGSSDEDVYLSGFSGDFCKVKRIGRPAVLLKRPCLTILWLVQPDVLDGILKKRNLTESGLLPRFLVCNTRAEPQEMPETPFAVPQSTLELWKGLVTNLLLAYRSREDASCVFEPTRDAFAVLRTFHNEVVCRRKTGGDLHDISIYPARWAEMAWRMSVVLHAAEYGSGAHEHSLSEVTARAAVRLVKWYAMEQLGVLKAVRHDRKMERIEKLREVLIACPKQRIAMRDLSRRHGFEREEIENLTREFPHLLSVTNEKPQGAGRPSTVVCIPRG